MSSALATPSSNIRMASSEAIRSRRLVAKPGTSRTVMVVFPVLWANSRAMAKASSLVWSPRINSTMGSDHTGLKKCMPKKWPGSVTDLASSLMDNALVLEAINRG